MRLRLLFVRNKQIQSGGVSGNEYHIWLATHICMGDTGSNPVLTTESFIRYLINGGLLEIVEVQSSNG